MHLAIAFIVEIHTKLNYVTHITDSLDVGNMAQLPKWYIYEEEESWKLLLRKLGIALILHSVI